MRWQKKKIKLIFIINMPHIQRYQNLKKLFSPHANIYLGSTFVPKIKFKPPMLNEIEHFFLQ